MEKREKWAHQWESTIAAIGVSLGSYSLFIFPYRFYANGGGLFWIPYLFMEIFIGTPLTFMFLSLGQYCSSGILTCWKFAPLCSGIGGSMFLLCFLTSLYFALLPAWSLIYLVNTGHLANQECSLSVSSFLPSNVSSPDCTKIFQTFYEETVGNSNNIAELGSLNWKPAIGLLVVYIIVFFFLVLGVKVYGKILYVTTILPFVCMIALLIRGATLEGSGDGITAVMAVNVDRIGEEKAWYLAFMSMIFRTVLGVGIYITIGSYNKFHNDTVRDTFVIEICKVVYSILTVLTSGVFSGYYWHLTQTIMDPYPLAGVTSFLLEMQLILHSISAGGFWMFVLQISLLCNFLTILSCFTLTMITSVTDLFPVLRKKIVRSFLLAILCFLLFLLGLPGTTQAGVQVLNYMDGLFSYPAHYIVILCSSCIAVGYFYGVLKFSDDIKVMVNDKVLLCLPWIVVKIFFIPSICVIVPWLIAIFGGLAAKEFNFENRFWEEDWQVPVANFLVSLIVIPIPLAALIISIIRFLMTQGNFLKRLSSPFTPTKDWGPVEVKHRQEVEGHLKRYGFIVNTSGTVENDPMPFTNINSTIEQDITRV